MILTLKIFILKYCCINGFFLIHIVDFKVNIVGWNKKCWGQCKKNNVQNV